MNRVSRTDEFSPNIDAKAPWWMYQFRTTRQLWNNPIFRWFYSQSRIKPLTTPLLAFLIGAGWSVLFNLIALIGPYFGYEWQEHLMIGGLVGVVGPLQLIYTIVGFWLVMSVMLRTPYEVEKNLGGENLNVVLATPLTDRELYLGAALPNVVRSIEVLEQVVLLSFGMFIPFYLLTGIPVAVAELPLYISLPIIVLSAPVAILIVAYYALTLSLVIFLIALAAAMYAVLMKSVTAILMTIVHYLFVSLVVGIFSQLTLLLMSMGFIGVALLDFLFPGASSIASIILAEVIRKVLVLLAIVGTGYVGINVFSNARRSGYYIPLNATSATLKPTPAAEPAGGVSKAVSGMTSGSTSRKAD